MHSYLIHTGEKRGSTLVSPQPHGINMLPFVFYLSNSNNINSILNSLSFFYFLQIICLNEALRLKTEVNPIPITAEKFRMSLSGGWRACKVIAFC